MGAFFYILILLTSGSAFAEAPELGSHALPPIPTPTETLTPTATPSRTEQLGQSLWQLHLNVRALDEIARLLQDPSVVSAETFAKAFERLPKNLFSAEQRTKLFQWASAAFSGARGEARARELNLLVRKVAGQMRAMLEAPNRAQAAPMPNEVLTQIQENLKAQLGELQSKVDAVLAQQAKKPTKSVGRENSELLNKLLADLEKPKPSPAPTPMPPSKDEVYTPAAAKNSHEDSSRSFPERDGLRPPPREARDSRPMQANNSFGGGNQNGSAGSEAEKKKDDGSKKGGSLFGPSKRDDSESVTPKKEKKEATPAPTATPSEPEKVEADSQSAVPSKLSELPLVKPANDGAVYNAPSMEGSGGSGGAATAGILTPSTTAGGDPFSGLGQQEYPGSGGAVVPIAVSYGSSGGGMDEAEPVTDGGGDETTAVRGLRPPSVVSQIINTNPAADGGRHWLFESAGTLVRLKVCEGVDAGQVAVCRTLKARAQAKRVQALSSPALGQY